MEVAAEQVFIVEAPAAGDIMAVVQEIEITMQVVQVVVDLATLSLTRVLQMAQ